MSNAALTWAFHLPLKDQSAKAVLVALANYANKDTWQSHPAVPTLMQCTSRDDRTVQRALKRLVELGLIVPEYRAGRVTVYTLQRDHPPVTMTGDTPVTVTPPSPRRPVTMTGVPPSNPPPTPVTVTDEPIREPITNLFKDSDSAVSAVEGFAEFWKIYPRRDAKAPAKKAYSIALKKAPAEVLLLAAREFAESRANEDPKFTPHASTWLNQERWLDDLKVKANGRFNGSGHVNGQPKHRDGWAALAASFIRDEVEPDEI